MENTYFKLASKVFIFPKIFNIELIQTREGKKHHKW